MEKIGWFDMSRDHGAPTWYGDNRTRVVTDIVTLSIVLVFAAFAVAFLTILPGVRKHKISSFLSVSLSLSVGALILVTLHHPHWRVAQTTIYAPYCAHTAIKLDAKIGVSIGLSHVNITLSNTETRHPGSEMVSNIDYNERFYLNEVSSMQRELAGALTKGLPYPILSVIEYLSVDRAGFIWGRQYRLAGYYTSCMLYVCFALWIIQLTMLCLLPVYYSRATICEGIALWVADVIYVMCSPLNLRIRFPDVDGKMPQLEMSLGWCFWLTVAAGAICLLFGVSIRICELRVSNFKFETFLQADTYPPLPDTPVSRSGSIDNDCAMAVIRSSDIATLSSASLHRALSTTQSIQRRNTALSLRESLRRGKVVAPVYRASGQTSEDKVSPTVCEIDEGGIMFTAR